MLWPWSLEEEEGKFVFISDLVKGVRVIRGFEKKNLVKLIWWAREHVRVTCGSIPFILTGFWH